jgi:hypothetical protein
MNLCRSCGEDFGSITAFDAHRVGSHEYTSTEGLRMEPSKEDGRRCLSVSEMKYPPENPLFTVNDRGTWSITVELEKARALARPISSKPHGSIPGGDKEAAEGA